MGTVAMRQKRTFTLPIVQASAQHSMIFACASYAQYTNEEQRDSDEIQGSIGRQWRSQMWMAMKSTRHVGQSAKKLSHHWKDVPSAPHAPLDTCTHPAAVRAICGTFASQTQLRRSAAHEPQVEQLAEPSGTLYALAAASRPGHRLTA